MFVFTNYAARASILKAIYPPVHTLYSYSLTHIYVSQSYFEIIKKILNRKQFPFQCVTIAYSGNIYENLSNIFNSLLDINPCTCTTME